MYLKVSAVFSFNHFHPLLLSICPLALSKFLNATLTDSTTKAVNVQSLSAMALLAAATISLGNHMLLFVVGVITGILNFSIYHTSHFNVYTPITQLYHTFCLSCKCISFVIESSPIEPLIVRPT